MLYTDNIVNIKQILRICFILTILSIGKVLAFNGQGQGTPESPYLISTADQLKEIKDDMDVHYKLVNDIEITTQWSYIGSSLLAFTGTLDGNYNQITLNIQNNTSTNTALFYQIGEHGIVKNLGVKIDKNTTNIQSGIQGGTIALKNSGIIEKCFSEGAISQQIDHSSPLTSGLGGIVGYNAPTGTVNNCYSSVSLKNTAVNEAGIGGIVGLNEGTVDHCIALNPQIESSTSQYTKDPRGNRIIGVNKATNIGNNDNYASPNIDCIPASNPGGIEGAILPQSIDWKEWNSNEKTFGLKKTDSENFGTTFHYSDHTYLTGEGTKDSPYLISSISDFQTMAKYLNNNYLDKGVHYKLTEDIDMDNKTFNPIGGENSFPFYSFDAPTENAPKIGVEISDLGLDEFSEGVKAYYEGATTMADIAKKAAAIEGADFVALILDGGDPNGANKSVEELIGVVKEVADAIDCPLVVEGCKNVEKDAELLPKVAEVLQGRNALLLSEKEENYKAIGAAAGLAYNQIVGAESAVDINLAKQLNVVTTQLGVDAKKIVMNIGSAAAGYGYEYVVSTMDRIKGAALGQNDNMLQMPIITPVSAETWAVKEATASEADMPEWGSADERGIDMEVMTAAADLAAGSDAVILRHPESIKTISKMIKALV